MLMCGSCRWLLWRVGDWGGYRLLILEGWLVGGEIL